MKNSWHWEWLVHLLTALWFFLLAGLLLLAPDSISTHGALGIAAFLRWLNSIGDLIMDSHNKIHYVGKSTKTAKKKK